MSDSDASDTSHDTREQAASEPPNPPNRPDSESEDSEGTANTLMNALIGAAVSIVLAFLPFSTVLGGGVAGYLQGGEYADGAKVGAISGVFAAIPFAFLLVFAGVFLLAVPVRFALALAAFAVTLLLVLSLYTVGLSALGGVLGVYVKRETDV